MIYVLKPILVKPEDVREGDLVHVGGHIFESYGGDTEIILDEAENHRMECHIKDEVIARALGFEPVV